MAINILAKKNGPYLVTGDLAESENHRRRRQQI